MVEVSKRAREAAEAWRIPSNADDTGELVKPRDHCIWGFERGYEQALADTKTETEMLREALEAIRRDANMRLACDIDVMPEVIEDSFRRIAARATLTGGKS